MRVLSGSRWERCSRNLPAAARSWSGAEPCLAGDHGAHGAVVPDKTVVGAREDVAAAYGEAAAQLEERGQVRTPPAGGGERADDLPGRVGAHGLLVRAAAIGVDNFDSTHTRWHPAHAPRPAPLPERSA